MSKTERALTSSESADALDELFDDDSFDAAFADALDDADQEFGIADPESGAVDEATETTSADAVEAADAAIIEDEAEVESDATLTEEVGDEPHATLTEEIDATDTEVDHQVETAEEPTTIAADIDSEPVSGTAVDQDLAEQTADDGDTIDDPHDDDGPTAELAAPRGAPVDDAPTPVNEPAVARDQPVGDPDPEVETDTDDEVSDRILEELRRAEIDGPVVAFAPQDDTTAARRRPKQAADYDPAPVPIPAKVPRVLGRKARVRKVTRVVRSVDPWSVFKIALIANFVMYVIVLTASVLLWNVAYATGTVDNIERFFESFGWNTFEFNGGELYHAGWIAGLFVVIGLTGLAVLGATLFNLITDLVGGMRFTVLEEEVVETRTSPMRRFVVRRSEPEVPAVIRDGSGAMYREAVVDDTGANERPTR
ncbi:DUF3566 domain-containing protein [Ilumatobacter nonamiensis]|uniref:DUF3566 domain-containing protein n=1 Tax=Ilumatobacter nonamiensis TaxID=467093 RepID=UPI00034D5AF5|nr:DUF3566 domain-containing protein [Ilumatobacter nonamiensis]